MSRKMIDYQVEGNKISTIDGYKVGGDELTGDALMGITKDSTTITRTLDTDGKVKFDAKDKLTFKTYSVYMTRPSTSLDNAAANLAAGKGITQKWGVAYNPTGNVEIQNALNNAKQITLQVAPAMIKIGNGYCLAIPVDDKAAYVNTIDGNKRVSGWFTLYPIVVDPNINSSTSFTPYIPITINIIY